MPQREGYIISVLSLLRYPQAETTRRTHQAVGVPEFVIPDVVSCDARLVHWESFDEFSTFTPGSVEILIYVE